MKHRRPYIVAGPCSVESAQQLKEVVHALELVPQVSMVRCGVWKPRTHPGGFEGYGERALNWIAEQKRRCPSMGFCCEVARAEHVELALRYGMDGVWIGARTTANPFVVQEVTEALRGVGEMTVMVKNAPSPDVQLWIGAVERCRQVGLTDVVAVHRGFDLYNNGDYRNNPMWEVPIELRRLDAELPILCDPSHIAGRCDLVPSLAQTAMNLGFDGLMVEVHPHPQQALTDAGQQITPEELCGLLDSLSIRQTDSVIADEQLHLLREQIDVLDDEVLRILASRMKVVEKIADVKKRDNLAVYQPRRWEQLLQQRKQTAAALGVDSDFVEGLFEKIHAESVRLQEQKMKSI